MKKRIFALFLSVLLLATVLCACGDTKQEEAGGVGSDGTSSSGAVVDGGEMVVGIAQDLGDSLDPYQMTAAGTREVLFNIYEGLVKPNASGEYVPAVASDSTVSEDGLTYTFPLREGVLFHNGAAVTTDDVIYSFKTCAETTVDTALAEALSSVKDITADGNTVTVTLKEANPDFLSYVGMVYIVPADYTDDAKQTELYKQAAAMLSETAANVYIQDLADFVLLKNNLDGYQFYPLYVMDLSTVHYVQ